MVELGLDGNAPCNAGAPPTAEGALTALPPVKIGPACVREVAGNLMVCTVESAAVGPTEVCIAIAETAIIGKAAARTKLKLGRLALRPNRMMPRTIATRVANWRACRRARWITWAAAM